MSLAFNNQKPEFLQIAWNESTRVNDLLVNSTSSVNTVAPGHLSHRKPSPSENSIKFWGFKVHRGISVGGLAFEDVVVHKTQSASSIEKVFKSISFSDIKVVLVDQNNSNAPKVVVVFDLNRAFSHANSYYVEGSNGKKDIDDLYQRGYLLSLYDDLNGRCGVRVEMSMVFRGEADDGDPAGAFDGFKAYPQLSFTWFSDGNTHRVINFKGSIKLDVETVMPPGHMGTSGNVASFYTDSNTAIGDTERNRSFHANALGAAGIGGTAIATALSNLSGFGITARIASIISSMVAPYIRTTFPDWINIFDYSSSNITRLKMITAVYGPGSKKYREIRPDRYEWPVGTSDHMNVRKVKRQGDYDNIHIHGKMNSTTRAPHGDVKTHAPFCIHSCIHLHWRWAAFNSIVASLAFHPSAKSFKGWGDDKGFKSFTSPGAPMAPPNQNVKITLSRPNAFRSSNGSIGGGNNLNASNKMIWYDSEISSTPKFTINSGERHVTFEHGIGWAFRFAHRKLSLLNSVSKATVTEPMIALAFSTFYDLIRYYDGDFPGMSRLDETGPQLPQGTHRTGGATAMQDL